MIRGDPGDSLKIHQLGNEVVHVGHLENWQEMSRKYFSWFFWTHQEWLQLNLLLPLILDQIFVIEKLPKYRDGHAENFFLSGSAQSFISANFYLNFGTNLVQNFTIFIRINWYLRPKSQNFIQDRRTPLRWLSGVLISEYELISAGFNQRQRIGWPYYCTISFNSSVTRHRPSKIDEMSRWSRSFWRSEKIFFR